MNSFNPFNLENKVAIITGGATGIGYGIAEIFIKSGAKVILLSRNEKNLIEACNKLKPNCYYKVCDITNYSHTQKVIKEIENDFKKIDILVNNAGNHFKKEFLETDIEDFDKILKTHLYGAFNISKECAKIMKKNSYGSILFIASMTSFIGQPLVISYSAAKSAYLGMIRTLAVELAKYNIRTNGIAPGWIKTEMTKKALDSDLDRKNRVLSRTPLNRLGDIEDIGYAALYLCSDKAKFVNGSTICIDGGALIGF
jgi:gluconate 5-dehydrogenase